MSSPDSTVANKAVSNGIEAPDLHLPFPDKPEIITANLLELLELTPDPRLKFLMMNLVKHMHQFVNETSVTTEEWMNTIKFLTRTGQTCTSIRQEFILLSDVLGISALVDALNNPPIEGATESSVLGPFWTDDAPDIEQGGSIVSDGKGENMYVQGRVLSTSGEPIPCAIIETWETDENGFYDTQYADRNEPDCRGKLRTDADGTYGYRAVVPVAYPIPGDGPVGQLLIALGRHNMRPNHLHLTAEAHGYRKLVTALYPEGCPYITSDSVFGVKESLVVKLEEVKDEAETRKRGFTSGSSFKLIKFDIILVPEAKKAAREQFAKERAKQLSV